MKLGENNGTRVEVIDGLKEGESVIEAPEAKITDGVKIKRANKASSKR
jgi:hypothetical protein